MKYLLCFKKNLAVLPSNLLNLAKYRCTPCIRISKRLPLIRVPQVFYTTTPEPTTAPST